MPQSIPKGLTRECVLQALADLDAGVVQPFGPPTGYELVHGGRRYAPKAVIGLACQCLAHRTPRATLRELDLAKAAEAERAPLGTSPRPGVSLADGQTQGRRVAHATRSCARRSDDTNGASLGASRFW